MQSLQCTCILAHRPVRRPLTSSASPPCRGVSLGRSRVGTAQEPRDRGPRGPNTEAPPTPAAGGSPALHSVELRSRRPSNRHSDFRDFICISFGLELLSLGFFSSEPFSPPTSTQFSCLQGNLLFSTHQWLLRGCQSLLTVDVACVSLC